MVAKIFTFVCCFAAFNVATSQVIPRIVGPSFTLPIQETVLPCPNQYIVNQPSPFLPSNVVVDLPGYGVDAIYTSPVAVPATTTIIQDSTVANNLANALQLLIVSNVLSNTLPCMGAPEVVAPVNFPVLPPGYSYVY